ncbi:hypothetical protein MMC28_002324 [Mycoblastus sanguinarius]|nr:hypothetical protein [Mycoblastus sanguinarius]
MKGEQQYTWAERESGVPYNFPLPYRVLSNDGLCFLQIVLVPGALSGDASLTQIGQAGYTLLRECVIKRGLGGIAAKTGGDNNLNVVIASYRPTVRCDRTSTAGPPWESCIKVFAAMNADRAPLVFGDPQDPRVQVPLPLTLPGDSSGRCKVEVNKVGPSTTSTYYHLWEAVMAVGTMCLRSSQKGGKASGIGARGNMYLTLSNHQATNLAQSSSNISLVDISPGLDAQNFYSDVTSPISMLNISFESSTSPVQENSALVTLPGSDLPEASTA